MVECLACTECLAAGDAHDLSPGTSDVPQGIDGPGAHTLSAAQRKAYVSLVRWITGTAAQLRRLHADLIIMTGNVTQVFVMDEEWMVTLCACRDALRPDGRLVFEVRDPTAETWKGWNREQPYKAQSMVSLNKISICLWAATLLGR
jgi:hypothetical protein